MSITPKQFVARLIAMAILGAVVALSMKFPPAGILFLLGIGLVVVIYAICWMVEHW